MLKIVICDDESFFPEKLVKKIKTYLKDKEISFRISTFASGERLEKVSGYRPEPEQNII